MATATVAKSVFRNTHNIVSGYGEVPGLEDEKGQIYYGLPGGRITKCQKEALAFAEQLDHHIRKDMRSVNQLISR